MKKTIAKKILIISAALALFGPVLAACSKASAKTDKEMAAAKVQKAATRADKLKGKNPKNLRTLYLAGGCFWGIEAYFRQLKGVVDTDVGYANGKSKDTSYETLKQTDHAETVKIVYDKNLIHPAEIIWHFYRVIDPYSVNKQGNDIGRQYRSGIYFDPSDKPTATVAKLVNEQVEKEGGKYTAVEILPLDNFIKAEDYHQDYLKKNPNGYCHINPAKASDPLFSDKKYPKPDTEELKKKLSPLEYKVTQHAGTEKPFTSELEKLNEKGIYVDVVSGQALYSSVDKFDSGCGWPSFSKEILSKGVTNEKEDRSFGSVRTELRSSQADSHLGHIFEDGPEELGGMRHCINGAALRFVPYDKMDELGYGRYKAFTIKV